MVLHACGNEPEFFGDQDADCVVDRPDPGGLPRLEGDLLVLAHRVQVLGQSSIGVDLLHARSLGKLAGGVVVHFPCFHAEHLLDVPGHFGLQVFHGSSQAIVFELLVSAIYDGSL